MKKLLQSLSKQSSLIERVDSSDEDHTPVEEQGMCGYLVTSRLINSHSLRFMKELKRNPFLPLVYIIIKESLTKILAF